MPIEFPSLEFFESLKQRESEDPGVKSAPDPKEAYCGLMIGDSLFVLEFDEGVCAAVASGGNTLDLDFYLSAAPEIWRDAISQIREARESTLQTLVDQGSIEVCTEADDGEALGRSAVPRLQTFLDQAKHIDVRFA